MDNRNNTIKKEEKKSDTPQYNSSDSWAISLSKVETEMGFVKLIQQLDEDYFLKCQESSTKELQADFIAKLKVLFDELLLDKDTSFHVFSQLFEAINASKILSIRIKPGSRLFWEKFTPAQQTALGIVREKAFVRLEEYVTVKKNAIKSHYMANKIDRAKTKSLYEQLSGGISDLLDLGVFATHLSNWPIHLFNTTTRSRVILLQQDIDSTAKMYAEINSDDFGWRHDFDPPSPPGSP